MPNSLKITWITVWLQ